MTAEKDLQARQSDFKIILNSERIDDILNKKIDLVEWLMEKKRIEEQETLAALTELCSSRDEKENRKLSNFNRDSAVRSASSSVATLADESLPYTTESTKTATAGEGGSRSKVSSKRSFYSSPLDKMRDLFKIENEQVLIDTLLLSVEHPKMTSQLFNYLCQKGCLEYFMSKITLLPNDTDLCNEKTSLQLKLRDNNGTDKEIKAAFKATDILATLNTFSKQLFLNEGERILSSLLRMCHHDARGSFYHFRKVFQLLLIRCPDALAMMLKPLPDLFGGQVPIMTLLPCIINSPIQDCLITYFVKANSRTSQEQKEYISKGIASNRFLEELFDLMIENDTPDIVLNSLSVVKRIFLSSLRPPTPQPNPALDLSTSNPPSTATNDEQGFLFDEPLLNGDPSPLTKLVGALKSAELPDESKIAYTELIHSILITKGATLNVIKDVLIPTVKDNFTPFAEFMKCETTPIILKVLSLDITEIILASSIQPSRGSKTVSLSDTIPIPAFASAHEPKDTNQAFYTSIPWRALTDFFFEKHSGCGMYLGRVVKVFNLVIQSRDKQCLENLCISGFFDRLVDQYLEDDAGSDLNAHVALCISYMLRSSDSKPEADALEWKTVLGGQPQRWDQVLEMAKKPTGLVFFLNAESVVVKPVIAAVPPRENIMALLNVNDDDTAAAAEASSSAADILASITRSATRGSAGLDDCEIISDDKSCAAPTSDLDVNATSSAVTAVE